MKKIIPILTALLAAGALASCGGSKEKEYKKPTDTKLWAEVLNKTLAKNGSTDLLPGPAGGGIIEPDAVPSSGGRVELTTKQTVSTGEVAEIIWDYDASKSKIEYEFASDDTHKMLEFAHEAKGGNAQYFDFTIKSIIIGDYKLDNADLTALYQKEMDDPQENLNYTVTLNPYKYTYEDLKISDLYKGKDNGYDTINYDKESPYFRTIEDQDYRYMNVKGKVVYMTDDFNWGLIADGDQIAEVYFGGSDGSRAKYFPGLRVGKYVEVRGNLSQYNGNFQIGFATRAHEITDHSMIVEPTAHAVIDEAKIAAYTLKDGTHEYVIPGFMNSLGQVTGTYVAGSLQQDGKSAASITKNVRCTFEMQVGAQKMKIAYDYHTGKNVDSSDNQAFLDKLNTIFDGQPHTIKGTVRYEGKGVAAKVGTGTGVWTIAPCTPDDIA